MADLADRIAEVAGRPFEVETEEGRSKQHSLGSLVEADKYLRKVTASTGTTLASKGIQFGRFVPPGAVGPVR